MKFTREELARAVAVLDANDRRFINLVRVAGLDPQCDLVGADLRRVDFGADDYSGFDFAHTDLGGARLERALGLRADMFFNARGDDKTLWPDGLREAIRGFDVAAAARALLLAGRAPRASWRKFIHHLDLSATLEEWNENRNSGMPPPQGSAVAFHRADLLAGLTALQSLDLSFTKVSDVAPLAGLAALQSLSLNGTQVSDVAPLASLAALQSLNLISTKVSDVAPLASLAALQLLNLGGTQVSDVAPLASLAALRTLDLSGTKVSDVAPLAHLRDLKIVSIAGPKPAAKQRRAGSPGQARR